MEAKGGRPVSAETFNRYGVAPFGSGTVWHVQGVNKDGVPCQDREPCAEDATRCVVWRSELMTAPAFWYFCEKHAARFVAWEQEGR